MGNTQQKTTNRLHPLFKDICWRVSEAEYRDDGRMHYSMLATFEKGGFEALDTLFDKKQSSALTFGAVVDCLITCPIKEFEERFVVIDYHPISDTYKRVIDKLFETHKQKYKSLNAISNKDIIQVTEEEGFYLNWKPETRVKAIREKEEYYEVLLQSEGKTVVTKEMYEKAKKICDCLLTHNNTSKYFYADELTEDKEILYQEKLFATIKGIEYSSMFDMLIIDHKAKTIQPCDIKTTSKKEYDFYKSFLEYRYDIQAAQYTSVIKENIRNDDYFKDFYVKPFLFLVINGDSLNPLVWEWEYNSVFSTVTVKTKRDYKIVLRDFTEIAQDLHYYLTNEVNVPIDIKENEPNKIKEWIKR